MSKNSHYFSHDYNARSDEKIKRLIRKHGLFGYGLFWAIVEDLYNNANALRTDYDSIAFDLRADCEVVKSIINDFDLFMIDGDFFGSASIQRRLDERFKKSEKARESASYRWDRHKDDANALRAQSDRNAIKERKGKKNKGNENKGDLTLKNFADETAEQKNEGATETGQARTETPTIAPSALQANPFHTSAEHRKRLDQSPTVKEAWLRAMRAKFANATMSDLMAQIETWDLLFDNKHPRGSSFDEYRKHHTWRLNDLKMLPIKPKEEQTATTTIQRSKSKHRPN